MQVSLIQPHRPAALFDNAPRPLLAAGGARVVLGGLGDEALAAPIRPSAHTLFGPRGAALAGPRGPFFVCDTGPHRLLAWRLVPEDDGTPADLVFGQPDFVSEGRNAKREVGPHTLNVPTGVA